MAKKQLQLWSSLLQRYLALYFICNKRCTGHILMTSASLGLQNKHGSFPQTFSWEPWELKRQELWLSKPTSCNQRRRLRYRAAPESPPLLDSLPYLPQEKTLWDGASVKKHIERANFDTLTFFLKLCLFPIHSAIAFTSSQPWSNFPFLLSKDLHSIESRPDCLAQRDKPCGPFPVVLKFVAKTWLFFQIILHDTENATHR